MEESMTKTIFRIISTSSKKNINDVEKKKEKSKKAKKS